MTGFILAPDERAMIREQAHCLIRSVVAAAPGDWKFCHVQARDAARNIMDALHQDGRIPDEVCFSYTNAFHEEALQEIARIHAAMAAGGEA